MLVSCSVDPPAAADVAPPRLVALRVDAAPLVDGQADDAAWQRAIPLQVPVRPAFVPAAGEPPVVDIRAVHTEGHLAFLVSWADTTPSTTHKSWVWDAEGGQYIQGDDREDMFALAFELTGPFDADMLADVDASWDVWHWKAARTNPQGYATDKTHVYTTTKPAGKAKEYEARNGRPVWIARPEDAGDSVERKQPAPQAYTGDRVPHYLPGSPTGSAADVAAKGVWADGRWTLEVRRALRTGHEDDTQFDTARTYRMVLAPFDHTGEMDTASGVIELVLGEAVTRQTFEDGAVGDVPDGFTAAHTGKGRPGSWEVREDLAGPTGGRVVAQMDADRTNYRFPILVHDSVRARDVDLAVRFRPVSGRVDQAAGLVWRYQDPNNYYVVRANALEDNVVMYKVEAGKRTDLPVTGAGRSYGVKTPVPAHEWSRLRVVATGPRFAVYLNGRHLFEVEDATFAEAGSVGLWTKADSVTAFDDFLVIPLDAG